MQLSDSTHRIFTELGAHPASVTQQGGILYALGEPEPGQRQLIVLAPPESRVLEQFVGEASAFEGQTVLIGAAELHRAPAPHDMPDSAVPRRQQRVGQGYGEWACPGRSASGRPVTTRGTCSGWSVPPPPLSRVLWSWWMADSPPLAACRKEA